jgi:ATP-dependent exoDNAse (exonuclease V) alpha subunit
MQLTDDQINANKEFNNFMLAENEKYMVIQGKSGSGKSTLVKYILATIEQRRKMYALLLCGKNNNEFDVKVTATTNKAASVLEDFIEEKVTTIHSLLNLIIKSNTSTGSVSLTKKQNYCLIRNTLIIIDEASFISDELFKILDETTINCKILFVGDWNQLTPVKQKSVIMKNMDCRKVIINQIMRNSGIIMQVGEQLANTVETGLFAPILTDNLNLIHADKPTFKRLIDEAFTSFEYNQDYAKVLAWSNKRVIEYNSYIRSHLGLDDNFVSNEIVLTNKPIMHKNFTVQTDSFVRIEKIYNCYNNNTINGVNVKIKGENFFLPNNQEDVWVLLKKLAKEKQWSNYFYIKENWLDLRSIYAGTIHKSQGSTYDKVFIDLDDIGKCNLLFDVARMLYVAITRARNQVILYGNLPTKYKG